MLQVKREVEDHGARVHVCRNVQKGQTTRSGGFERLPRCGRHMLTSGRSCSVTVEPLHMRVLACLEIMEVYFEKFVAT